MQPHYRDPLPLGDADGLPYSKGLMARALVSAGVSIEAAYEIATRLELDLIATGAPGVEQEALDETAASVLGESDGARIVLRMKRLAALKALDLPIVLLVGGATGTGKSTVATEAAHRLGITRVTSTDFIRQTIRAYFPPSRMPSVHVSSFEAGGSEGATEAGFIEQTQRVLVGVEASVERALNEGWSMAIEGVHLVPGMVPGEIEGALLVHAVLRVESIEEHRSHFVLRDSSTGGERPLAKYIEGLEEIRTIQDVIVERAVQHGVPVIESSSIGHATTALLDLVLSRAGELEPIA
jgi:2-phosphoglycerate kinase